MGANSKIEWTDHTFNPWRGCTKVSAGCANCYAETLSGRNPGTLGVWGPSGTRVVASESMWKLPLKWNREAATANRMNAEHFPGMLPTRPRVFCASLADVFEDWAGPMVMSDGDDLWACDRCGTVATRPLLVSDYSKAKSVDDCPDCGGTRRPATMQDVRARLFSLIDATPHLDWLLLTKRPEYIARMMPGNWLTKVGSPVAGCTWKTEWRNRWALPANLWLGVSVESQQAADERIPHLLRVPAAVRFLSCEPLLGPVDLRQIVLRRDGERGNELSKCLGDWVSPLTGAFTDSPRIHWVIVGGESGPGARPMHPDWARSLRDQCQAAGVPFFFKQWGEWCPSGQKGSFGGAGVELRDIGFDGAVLTGTNKDPNDERWAACYRVGKKNAGRLLDGREWDGLPNLKAKGLPTP